MSFLKESHFQLCLGLSGALLLGACGTPPSKGTGEQAGAPAPKTFHTGTMRLQREKLMQSQWSGKTYAALIEVLGQPKVVMDVPGRSDQSSARVYGILDENSQCIDAFTVVTFSGEPMVTNYFCR